MKFNHHSPSNDPATSPPPVIRLTTLLLALVTFSSMCAQRVCDAMLPELARVFSAPVADAARAISWFAITYGLMQLVYGPIGDRWGKYRVIVWATWGCALGCALSAISAQLDWLVAARMLTAMAAAAIIPLSLAWVGDAVDYSVRQETLARVGLGTMLGIAGGQLFGGLMSDTLGWRWAFGWLAVLFLAVGWRLQRQARVLPAPQRVGEDAPSFVGQLRLVAQDAWARRLLGIALLEGGLVFGTMAIAATHLHTVHGVSLTTAGSTTALFGVGGMLYMATAKWAIRRFGEIGLARWGGSLMGVCFGVLALTPWWPLAAPACLLAGFGFAMFHNTMQAKATQMVPTARATGVTLFAGFLFWGQSLGVVMLAQGMALWSSGTVIALVAVSVMGLGWLFARAIVHRNATQADHA